MKLLTVKEIWSHLTLQKAVKVHGIVEEESIIYILVWDAFESYSLCYRHFPWFCGLLDQFLPPK